MRIKHLQLTTATSRKAKHRASKSAKTGWQQARRTVTAKKRPEAFENPTKAMETCVKANLGRPVAQQSRPGKPVGERKAGRQVGKRLEALEKPTVRSDDDKFGQAGVESGSPDRKRQRLPVPRGG